MAILMSRISKCNCRACLVNVTGRNTAFFLIFYVMVMGGATGLAAGPPRMRPYTGIGLVIFSQPGNDANAVMPLQLYQEPGLLRLETVTNSGTSGNEWIFGLSAENSPLIVSARKGDWLRVYYDDAGREAWMDVRKRGRFLSWEQFLKLQTGRMLPGLQPLYYRLYQQPGGKTLGTLTPKQVFKVLKLENAWSMVLTEQSQIGWVRWSDDDGRLTIDTGKK